MKHIIVESDRVLQLTCEHELPVTGTQNGSLSLIITNIQVCRSWEELSTAGNRLDGQWIRDLSL